MPDRDRPDEHDDPRVEPVARVLDVHQIEYVDAEVGFECGCNEDGHLGALLTLSDAHAHQAAAVLAAVDATSGGPTADPSLPIPGGVTDPLVVSVTLVRDALSDATIVGAAARTILRGQAAAALEGASRPGAQQ